MNEWGQGMVEVEEEKKEDEREMGEWVKQTDRDRD